MQQYISSLSLLFVSAGVLLILFALIAKALFGGTRHVTKRQAEGCHSEGEKSCGET